MANAITSIDGESKVTEPPISKILGIVVVHGIGEQEPGASAEKLEASLSAVCQAEELELARVDPGPGLPTSMRIEGSDIVVRIYEAYWADVLFRRAHSSFTVGEVSRVLFRRRRQRGGPIGRILWAMSRVLLFLVWLFVAVGQAGLSRPLSLVQRFRFFAGLGRSVDEGNEIDLFSEEPTKDWWEASGLIPRRSWVDRKLDDFAGDVLTYTRSATRSGEPAATDQQPSAHGILQRFHQQLYRATLECDEVQIVAHSLGSVIAYHGLTGYGLPEGEDLTDHAYQPLSKLTFLYTIGSPLEKIRRFWPELITGRLVRSLAWRGSSVWRVAFSRDPAVGFRWINFHNPLDLVADRLRHFDHWDEVDNRRVFRGGVFRSHLAYETNHAFLTEILQRLTPQPWRVRRRPIRALASFVVSVFEALGLLVAPILLFLLGLVVLAVGTLVAALGTWATGWLVGVAGWDALGEWIQGIALPLGGVTTLTALLAQVDAEWTDRRPSSVDEASAQEALAADEEQLVRAVDMMVDNPEAALRVLTEVAAQNEPVTAEFASYYIGLIHRAFGNRGEALRALGRAASSSDVSVRNAASGSMLVLFEPEETDGLGREWDDRWDHDGLEFAHSFKELTDPEDAAAVFQRLSDLASDPVIAAEARINAALLLLDEDKTEQSLAILERVADAGIDGPSGRAMLLIGDLLAEAGRRPDAETWYWRGARSGDSWYAGQASVELGHIYVETEDLEQAAECYERALGSRVASTVGEAAWNLGRILEEKSELDEALEVYRYALDTLKNGPADEVAFRMGELNVALGDLKAAWERYRHSATSPDLFIASLSLLRLGDVLAASGQDRDAVVAYEQAEMLRHPSTSSLAAGGLGHVLQRSGDPIGAVAARRRAAQATEEARQIEAALARFDSASKDQT